MHVLWDRFLRYLVFSTPLFPYKLQKLQKVPQDWTARKKNWSHRIFSFFRLWDPHIAYISKIQTANLRIFGQYFRPKWRGVGGICRMMTHMESLEKLFFSLWCFSTDFSHTSKMSLQDTLGILNNSIFRVLEGASTPHRDSNH